MSRNSLEKTVNPSNSPTRIVILGSGFASHRSLKEASEGV